MHLLKLLIPSIKRCSNYGTIIEASVSSKKAKEDAEDTVHYLDGVDEDDENEEAIEQLVNNSNAAWSFMNGGALQSEPKKNELSKNERRKRV